MIRNLSYILIAFLLAACSAGNLNVEGKVSDGKIADGDSIFLVATQQSGESRIVGRTVVRNAAFHFSTDAETPCICSVVTYTREGAVKNKVDFVADSSWVGVSISAARDILTGSTLNGELQRVNDSLFLVKEIYTRYHNKKRDIPTLSQMAVQEADDVMAVTAMYSSGVVTRAIERNMGNKLAPYFIKKYNGIISPADCVRMIEALPAQEKEDVVIKYLHNLYSGVLNTAIGKPYVDFVQATADGKSCRFSDIAGRGKDVILSIWSSGIKASVNGQKMLKELLVRKGDALALVAVSLDTSYNTWCVSMSDNALAGTQLTDLRGWQNEVLQLYGIDRCPYYVLVDGAGVVRYRGDNIAEMEKILE